MQTAWMIGSTGAVLVGLEAVMRVVDGGALPQLDCYVTDEAQVLFAPGCRRMLRSPEGPLWSFTTDASGDRFPAPTGPSWVIAGDSQVLGMHLPVDDAFVTRLGAPATVLAVPGHGPDDMVAQVRSRLNPDARGVVFVVDGMNDWFEAGRPASTRYVVTGGWLLPADHAPAWARAWFGSPLAHLHLPTAIVMLAGHDWSTSPAERRWAEGPFPTPEKGAAIGALLLGFAREHPGLDVRVVWLPADFATSEARARAVLPESALAAAPWDDHRPDDALHTAVGGLPWLDLRPRLADPADFLPHDGHLSAQGHRVVADALREWLGG